MENVRYRIRKLTPRECFRLMGVDDSDTTKIQEAGISNSQMYKLAGNSIVKDTLFYIFEKAKESTENTTVMEYKIYDTERQVGSFTYNKYGICLNPKESVRWENKKDYFVIRTAISDNGRWNYSVEWCFDKTWGGKGARYVESPAEGYDTENNAVIASLDMLQKYSTNPNIEYALKKYRAENTVIQMALF